ncbi:hypothetical protein [Methyloterricola oryzae]|uniref:hypothetical protein n=1 Tax=Methyloterricola oryzae TaxID=1495050 RepID=UPI0005EB0C17|nr:hypothetical protein [Methyloterricola oryzae]
MLTLPTELTRLYEALLAQHDVLAPQRPYYLKWLRYYWDFCHKYAHTVQSVTLKEAKSPLDF